MIEHEPDPLRRIPTKHTVEIHAEVGAVLRAARLKRGQSVEAVAQQTRIPKRYLEALENDRFDEFPAFVYMRGFLKSYCDHLDLSFDELWAKIQPSAESAAAPEAPGAPAAAAPSKPAAPAPHSAAPAHAPSHEPASSATGAMLFAGALAVGLGIWMYNDRKPEPGRASESTPRALMPLPRTVEPKVGLRAAEDAWVRVAVDGNVVFEGRLPRGASMEWKPSRSIALRSTAPGALELTVNGNPQALGNPTPDGEYRIDVP